ncbi:Histidinol-phosphate aminotransferase [termite gut metagenome]|uniref:histidinol-phosphate transaminase n=1 Tax=termite gut metagenome TaxID=433724 RepID=A0A5J4S095_9ZZZZ
MKTNKTIFFIGITLLLFASLLSSCQQEKANETKPESERLIKLSLNENPFAIPESIKDSIIRELPNINRYSAEEGEAFVRFLATHEGVDPVQIIPGEILELLGIYLGLEGGLGSEFIYTVPGYPALVNAAQSVGGKVISVPLNDNLENDLDAIEAKVNDKTQAVFLVNPHNPSGTVSDKKALHNFISRISQKALVVVDEAYLEYTDDFEGRTALVNLQAGENVIVFRTFAKVYGLGGLGIGYAIAPKKLAKHLRAKGLGDTHALNRLAIVAARAALTNRADATRVAKITADERNKWHAFLDEQGFRHSTSEANFIFFDIKKPYAEVYQQLKEKGIIIGPSYAPAYDTWLRISIGQPEDNAKVREVISLLKPEFGLPK